MFIAVTLGHMPGHQFLKVVMVLFVQWPLWRPVTVSSSWSAVCITKLQPCSVEH